MIKQIAEKKGLIFAGHYSYNKEEVIIEKNKYECKGYKAYVVNEPYDLFSRVHKGMGYSVYVEKKYFVDRRIKDIERYISRMPLKRKNAKEEYDLELNLINIHEAELKKEYYDLTSIHYEQIERED